MRDLSAEMRRFPCAMLASIACAVLGGALSFAPQFGLWWLLSNKGGGDLLAALLIVGAATLGGFLLAALSTTLSHRAAFTVLADLRVQALQRLGRAPLGFFAGRHSGTLRKTLLDDVDKLEDGIAHLVPEGAGALAAPLVALVALLAMDWRLALAALLPTLLGFGVFASLLRKGESAAGAYYSVVGRISAATTDAVRAVPTLKTFNQERAALAETDRLFDEYMQVGLAWFRQAIAPMSVANVLLSSSLLFVLAADLLLLALGAADWRTVVVAAAFALGLDDLFTSLIGVSFRVETIAESYERIVPLLEAPELPSPALSKAQSPSDASIRFEGVTFGYGAEPVVQDLSFEIPAGSVAALVGASGAGKSTVARLVARFWDVREGSIWIGGADLRAMTPETLSDTVSLVLQEAFLFRGTIAENIALGRPEATRDEIVAAAGRARAHVFIERMPQGYDTFLDDRGAGLSGGERQRLSIARTILRDTAVLILDEATAHADPENEALIHEALDEVVRGRTVIVIAHRLKTVRGANRILVLERGRLAESGTHAELLNRNGLYARLWRRQQGEATIDRVTERKVTTHGAA